MSHASPHTIQNFFITKKSDRSYIELIPKLLSVLPESVSFEDQKWNVISWQKRKGNRRIFNINFSNFNNHDLNIAVKCYILDKRFKKKIDAGTAKIYISSINFLNQVIGTRSLNTISNADFLESQKLIAATHSRTAPSRARICNHLAEFGRWLNRVLGVRVSYKSTLSSAYLHGRHASDEAKATKLISTSILLDLMAARTRKDLIDKDKFFLSALTLYIPTGFRINEFMTLPKNCLLEENGDVIIRFYPEKKPRLGVRCIPSAIKEAVKSAYEYIFDFTEEGRKIAADVKNSRHKLNWPEIVQDRDALLYFIELFCHEWTKNPLHDMFNKSGAWFEKEKRYIDVIELINKYGNRSALAEIISVSRPTITYLEKAQRAALNNELPKTAKSRSKRTSWSTDTRVISIRQLEQKTEFSFNTMWRELFSEIIFDARDNYQLKGLVYPVPKYNADYHNKYCRQVRPVITDSNGNSVLEVEDALFVIEKYKLTGASKTRTNDYSLLTDKSFSRWLTGESRYVGTGNSGDSVFSRLGITDPDTGEIAKFTSHDIRHWLDTLYSEGGMSEEAIALLFNRTKSQNATYDQTSSKTRLENLRNAIREGKALGYAVDMYKQIAEYSREDAEQYLMAHTLMINIMPHGVCSHSWGLSPCPNQHSCFAGSCAESDDNKVCEHFNIDLNNQEQIDQIFRIERETTLSLDFMPKSSPQYEHLLHVQSNLRSLVKKVSSVDS